MKAIAYLRVSTEQQKEAKSGLRRQLQQCKLKANSLGFTEVYFFTDAGISGTQGPATRPALALALEILDPKDVFILYEVSRIARSVQFCSYIERYVALVKATLIIIKEDLFYNPHDEEDEKYFLAAAKAQVEQEKISYSTKQVLRSKRENGQHYGNIPYGYIFCEQTKSLQVNLKEQCIIDLVFTLNEQGHSVRTITKQVNFEGYRTRRNNLFYPSQICNILKTKQEPELKTKQKRVYKAVDNAASEVIISLRLKGYSVQLITQELFIQGYRTSAGTAISQSSVYRVAREVTPSGLAKTSGKTTLPYGLMYDTDGKTIISCAYEQEILYTVKELYQAGLNPAQICREVTLRGYVSRAKKPFQVTQITRFIKSKGYYHEQT